MSSHLLPSSKRFSQSFFSIKWVFLLFFSWEFLAVVGITITPTLDQFRLLMNRSLESHNTITHDSPPNIHLIFVGDSATSKLAKMFTEYHLPNNYLIGRCDLNNAFGFPKPTVWRDPKTTEGPLRYGLNHRNCHDSSSVSVIQNVPTQPRSQSSFSSTESNLMGYSPFSVTPSSSFQFLIVDSSRDTVIQTPLHDTSQENLLFEWLQLRYSHLSNVYIVVNVGLHDCSFPSEVYDRNLRWFLDLFSKALPKANLIWHSLSITKGNAPQTHQKMERFYEISRNVARRHHLDIVDCWNVSARLPSLLEDNVHHSPQFYYAKGKFILDVIKLREKEKKMEQSK